MNTFDPDDPIYVERLCDLADTYEATLRAVKHLQRRGAKGGDGDPHR
jgi:hypothetical protein